MTIGHVLKCPSQCFRHVGMEPLLPGNMTSMCSKCVLLKDSTATGFVLLLELKKITRYLYC